MNSLWVPGQCLPRNKKAELKYGATRRPRSARTHNYLLKQPETKARLINKLSDFCTGSILISWAEAQLSSGRRQKWRPSHRPGWLDPTRMISAGQESGDCDSMGGRVQRRATPRAETCPLHKRLSPLRVLGETHFFLEVAEGGGTPGLKATSCLVAGKGSTAVSWPHGLAPRRATGGTGQAVTLTRSQPPGSTTAMGSDGRAVPCRAKKSLLRPL